MVQTTIERKRNISPYAVRRGVQKEDEYYYHSTSFYDINERAKEKEMSL